MSKIGGFPEAVVPKEFRSAAPPSEEGRVQRQMRLAACARTAIALLLPTPPNNAIAVVTVRSGDKKRIALEKTGSHGTWDVDTGDSVPTTDRAVLVEVECQVKNAARAPAEVTEKQEASGSRDRCC